MSRVFQNTRSQTRKMKNKVFGELKVHNLRGNFKKHFISPSKLRDYFFDDGFVRLLNHKKLFPSNGKASIPKFLEHIFENGNKFETYVNEYLSQRYGDKYIQICENSWEVTPENHQRTIDAVLSDKYLVISSAPLINTENNTRGCADLIVKGSVITELFPYINPHSEIPIDLQTYYVIDIKNKNLKLKSDGYNFLRTPDSKYFVCQTYIYNCSLAQIQQRFSRYSFILGCGSSWTQNSRKYTSNNTFHRIGVIDFNKEVDIINDVKKYIRTERFIHKNKDNIDIDSIGMNILLPMFTPNTNPNINKIKNSILKDKKDITMLLDCGKKVRDNALYQGIYGLDDERCTSNNLGISSSKRTLLDSILYINRQDVHKILPQTLNRDVFEYTNSRVCFVDTETLYVRNYDNFPQCTVFDRVFLVGLYYFDTSSGDWVFKQFHIKDLNSEYELITSFHKFMKELDFPTLIHWHADEFIFRNSFKRVGLSQLFMDLHFVDLRKIFIYNNIVIKDVYKYDLKSIVKHMHNHKFIKTSYDTNCMNGMDAMIHAINFYQNKEHNMEIMEDIYRYNKIDTVVLKEILDYLHSKYI